jgi:acyl-CoA reductase-like NAD-dependent aldehyde dehydrogenase
MKTSHDAVVGFVLQVEQAQQKPGHVRPVRSCGAEQVGGSAVVVSAVADLQPCAADAVRCRDAGQHCEAGRDV